jgi:hypothetical protein
LNLEYWFLLLYSLLLDGLSVFLSFFALYFISFLMKTEQLAIILYKLISKTSASVEVPASINEKHFVRIIISDIANNEILDDLGG